MNTKIPESGADRILVPTVELEDLADSIDDAVGNIQPALLFMWQMTSATRPYKLITEQLSKLREQAAWARKFAREADEYQDEAAAQ